MTGKQGPKLAGMLVMHQDCFNKLTTEDAQWVIDNPQEAVALMVKAVSERNKNRVVDSFLRLISGGEALMLDALDGKEILAEANDVFAYIDSDFKNWRTDECGEATKETAVDVHEMVKDATFAQMFCSLSDDASKLCLTQAQIKNFVVKHRDWLRKDGYATFFLFKSKGKVFVAYVYFHSDGTLVVSVYKFEDDDRWYAEICHRLVVPQLA